MMEQRKLVLPFLLALTLFGAGCFSAADVPPLLPNPSISDPLGGAWTAVSEGFDRLDYRYSTSTSAKLIIYRLNEKRFDVRLQNGESKTVAAWSDAVPEAVLVSNAAYFHEDDSPSGFLKTGGKRVGERSFDLDKSGVVVLRPRFQMVDTLADPLDLEKIEEGFQSYPFLMKDGESAIATDSGLRARRTFIGTDRAGRIYLGLVEGDLSLFELATLLPSLGISWDLVLNLDGGPSSGLVTPLLATSRVEENTLTGVPSVLVVFPKK